eukprot:gene28969-32714_t
MAQGVKPGGAEKRRKPGGIILIQKMKTTLQNINLKLMVQLFKSRLGFEIFHTEGSSSGTVCIKEIREVKETSGGLAHIANLQRHPHTESSAKDICANEHSSTQPSQLEFLAIESRSSSSSSLRSVTEDELGRFPFLPEHSQFLRRRPSFLFLHLKLGEVQFLQSLHHPATRIQCLIRCFLARHKVARKRKSKAFGRVAQLKTWLVKIIRKRRVLKSLRVIQPVWRRQAQLCFRKRACSIKIQSAWRTHITRKNFKLLLKLRYFSSCKMIRWAHRRL